MQTQFAGTTVDGIFVLFVINSIRTNYVHDPVHIREFYGDSAFNNSDFVGPRPIYRGQIGLDTRLDPGPWPVVRDYYFDGVPIQTRDAFGSLVLERL